MSQEMKLLLHFAILDATPPHFSIQMAHAFPPATLHVLNTKIYQQNGIAKAHVQIQPVIIILIKKCASHIARRPMMKISLCFTLSVFQQKLQRR